MIILNVIFAMAAVSAVASVINLIDKRKSPDTNIMSMEVQLPGNLPIISLSNNGNMYNFIIDSGSNISHICEEFYSSLDSKPLGTYKNETIAGLGGTCNGITMCNTVLKDIIGHEYNVILSISKHLSAVAKGIKESTGIQIHGLLGTDFLKSNNYVLDFESLTAYPKTK